MIARHLKSALFAALATATLAAVAPVHEARATQFAELSTEQFVDASTYVLRGTVTEVWTETDERTRVWTRARVTVSDVLKGPDIPSEVIIDSIGGVHGDLTMTVPAQAVFSEGEELFAFLYQTDSGRLVPVSKFLGKFTIRRAPGETRQHIMNWHPKAGLKFDARFLPHPKPEHRQYLDDMIDRVQRRLDTGWDGKPIPGVSAERLREMNTLERRMPR